MSNPHCKCEFAGFCDRHQITKTESQVKLCRGEAIELPDCGFKFWEAWETGKFGAVAQDPPLLDDWECESDVAPPTVKRSGGTRAKATRAPRYLGDHVEQALSLVGITKDRVEAILGDCGCCGRQTKWNEFDKAVREILSGAVESGREKLGKLLDFIHQD